MEKLNVCLVNDSFPPVIDGVANAVLNYAGIIQRKYGDVTVVAPQYPGEQDNYPYRVLRYPSFDTEKQIGYRTGYPLLGSRLMQLERRGVDIIHCHCPMISTIIARTLRERVNAPLVLTYHTKYDIDIARAVEWGFLQTNAIKLIEKNISSCDEVWVVSRGAGENLRSIGYQGKYTVMENGVDFPRGRVPESETEAISRRHSLPEGVPVFLYVGRMMWYKGCRITLDALKRLSDGGQDFRMLFVGEGVEQGEIEKYAESLGLAGKCVFTGAIRDRELLRAYFCRADFFLFPSTFDTNGIVVREAAACAVPSVLVRGSCAAEDVTEGDNALLIDENAESMYEALRTVCAGLARAREMGERALSELYVSWEESVGRAYESYFGIVDDYRRGLYPKKKTAGSDLLATYSEAVAVFDKFLATCRDVRFKSATLREKMFKTQKWPQ